MAILDFDECEEAANSLKFFFEECRKPGLPNGEYSPAGCYDHSWMREPDDKGICFNTELDVSKWTKKDDSYRAVCKLRK